MFIDEKQVIDDTILDNCKKFLSSRMSKIYEKKSDKTNLHKIKLKSVSIFLTCRNHKINSKKETNKETLKIGDANNNKSFRTIPKIKLNKNKTLKNIILRKIKSAREIKSDKNINQSITKMKVKEKLKKILAKDKTKYISETLQLKTDLKKFTKRLKYIEMDMRKDPDDKKLYKTYKVQLKYFMNNKNRKLLIDGVNDYHENIKLYKDINYNSFYQENNKKNDIKNNINNKTINTNNSDIIRYSYKIYNGFKKFQDNYLKAYNEKRFNYNISSNKSERYINNNSYFKYLNESDFNHMMSVDQKLHNIYQSVNKTFRKKKKNSFISLKKYIK